MRKLMMRLCNKFEMVRKKTLTDGKPLLFTTVLRILLLEKHLQAVITSYLRMCGEKKKMRANKLQNVFVKFKVVTVAYLLHASQRVW